MLKLGYKLYIMKWVGKEQNEKVIKLSKKRGNRYVIG